MVTIIPRPVLPFGCAAGVFAAALLAGAASTARAAAAARLTPPGDLPAGSFFSGAGGVSADGSVVVGQSSSASGTEAFRWSRRQWMGIERTNGMDHHPSDKRAARTAPIAVLLAAGGGIGVGWVGEKGDWARNG